jgi:L-seryl-tRNA(Ser) seleniumtransferase
VVTFSGDKILGGPQAGILVGDKETLHRIRKNPLMRALRPDKLTLALLEETLKLYLSPGKLLKHHPVLDRLAEKQDAAMERARALHQGVISDGIPDTVRLDVAKTRAQLGSGALPLEEFPTAALRIRIKGLPASQLARELRLADPPIIGYVHKEWVHLDVKAIMDDEIMLLLSTLRDLFLRINK